MTRLAEIRERLEDAEASASSSGYTYSSDQLADQRWLLNQLDRARRILSAPCVPNRAHVTPAEARSWHDRRRHFLDAHGWSMS